VKSVRRGKRKTSQAALLGVGLDNQDGHKRITAGEKFVIVGGSEETHERMTETVVKTFEELKQRGKPLETVGRKELSEIIDRSTPR
jgi:heptaprenylglyceryl phosphate synthase